jgi:hypothetical protein
MATRTQYLTCTNDFAKKNYKPSFLIVTAGFLYATASRENNPRRDLLAVRKADFEIRWLRNQPTCLSDGSLPCLKRQQDPLVIDDTRVGEGA